MDQRSQRPAGWRFHPSAQEVVRPLDLVTDLEGDPPLSVHMVFSLDGAYVPAVIRRPEGSGPWPAVMCLHGGSGGLGFSFLAQEMRERGLVVDRLVEEGYLVCYAEGRMEREDAYGRDSAQVLDHLDAIEVFRYLQRLTDVIPDRVATFGVSHGGELQMKLASEMGNGPAALVPTEPAVIEFLGLRHGGGSASGPVEGASEDSSGPRVEERLQFRGDVSDDEIDIDAAWRRIERVSESLPILVIGRDDDHLQGLFHKLYELLQRAGKRAEWVSWDHPDHAYQFGPRKTDGRYLPDPVQQATLDHLMKFLNEHVRDRTPG